MIRGLNKLTDPQGLGYLMSSYTSHPAGFDDAADDAAVIAAKLLVAGLVVFAPIAYGPGIEKYIEAGRPLADDDLAYYRSHEFWMPICERFYQRCDYGIIATTSGWQKSKGIAIELSALTRAGIPVHFYDVKREHLYNLLEYCEVQPEEVNDLIALSIKMDIPYYLTESAENQREGLDETLAKNMLRNAVT